MNKLKLTCALILILISCTNQVKDNEFSNSIDIEMGLENLTTLKVSDFGKTIRFIPLETTEECLIGNNPTVKVLKNHIVVEVNRRCLLFDKKDGSFISEIGHTGQDPEAFSNPASWTDEKEDFLYFSQFDKLIKYDMKGNFAGKTEISKPPGLATSYLFTDKEIIGYYGGMTTVNYNLAFFSKEGVVQDSLTLLASKLEDATPENIANLNVKRLPGTKAGFIIINYKNGNRQLIIADAVALWKNNGKARFREIFIDTIYTVTNRELIPSIAFKTGKWHWPAKESHVENNSNERIFISGVSENDNFVFFQCIKGFYTDEPVVYNGLYNKKERITKMEKNNDAIQDDLTGFMPFKPISISSSGEFVNFIDAYTIMEWVAEHPEVKDNAQLSFLKDFNDERNPVVILVE